MSEPAETNSTNSVLHTPAYAGFDSNTDRLLHFIHFMGRGFQGLRQEEKLLKTKSFLSTLDANVTNYGLDKSPTEQVVEIKQVVSDYTELMESHISGFSVALQWMPVLWVTIAETYLMDVLAYAAGVVPELMEKSEISASYSETVKASSLEELRQDLRERWARNFINDGGPKRWIEKLKKMGANGYNPDLAEEMETLWGIRHLIVHTGGAVTADFVRRHPNFGATVDESLQVRWNQLGDWGKHIYHFVDVTDAFFGRRCKTKSSQTQN